MINDFALIDAWRRRALAQLDAIEDEGKRIFAQSVVDNMARNNAFFQRVLVNAQQNEDASRGGEQQNCGGEQ